MNIVGRCSSSFAEGLNVGGRVWVGFGGSVCGGFWDMFRDICGTCLDSFRQVFRIKQNYKKPANNQEQKKQYRSIHP